AVALSLMITGAIWPAVTGKHAIDTRKSVMTVHVSKAGALSAFGHDHEIAAAVAAGTVDTSGRRVEFRVSAAEMRVIDKKALAKDRADIRKAMLGPEVLDAAHHPEILFRSTAVEPQSANSWRVRGDLILHGQVRPVTVDVSEKAGHYTGNALLKTSDFN